MQPKKEIFDQQQLVSFRVIMRGAFSRVPPFFVLGGIGVLRYGVLRYWGIKVLRYWGIGVLRYWGIKVLGYWGIGVLGYWEVVY